jgi:putative oxidoreductase
MSDIKSFISKRTPIVLSIVRIMIALLVMEHGAQKLFGFPVPIGSVKIISMIGIAGIIEFFGGLIVALGLFTRPAAFIVSGLMAVAYFLVHAKNSFWPVVNQGELAIVYCFIFLFFAFAGGGEWSIDRIFRKKD